MFKREQLSDRSFYFKGCSQRGGDVYYFCRIDSYGQETREFLGQYMEEVKKKGVYLKGKIPNPDERQLDFLEEIIGTDFLPDGNFIRQTLKKWLPRLSDSQLEAVTSAMFHILVEMKRAGKTEYMLKNAYFKFMCWFYYKFEWILSQLGGEVLPKILYEGDISDYELKVLRILGHSGCDVLLVERGGELAYSRLDRDSEYSQLLVFAGAGAFPEDFSLASICAKREQGSGESGIHNRDVPPLKGLGRGMVSNPSGRETGLSSPGRSSGQGTRNIPPRSPAAPPSRWGASNASGQCAAPESSRPARSEASAHPPVNPAAGAADRSPSFGATGTTPSSSGRRPVPFRISAQYCMGTNTWLSGKILEDTLKKPGERGKEPNVIYNLFVCQRGCDSPGEFKKELVRWKLKLDRSPRKLVLVHRELGMVDMNDISRVRRGNYTSEHQLLSDMLAQISYPKCRELENLVKKAMVELLTEEARPLQAKINQAVLLMCWLNRFLPQLFPEWRLDTSPLFIFFGDVKNDNEALFLRLLARIPADVIILCPDPQTPCGVSDPRLFEKTEAKPMGLERFPQSADEISFGSAAYQAEQELDTLLYQDSGIYRNRQFKRAITVPIRITFEEIDILWKQEAKYRPDFEVLDDRVMLPVIFSKVSGVAEGDRARYWRWVKGLITEDTLVVRGLPYLTDQTANPVKPHVAAFLKNGKLLPEKIRRHSSYQYGFIREDMQDYMLDKLGQLLESRVIAGTFTQGVEYVICSVALNLEKKLLRMLQKYDFTRQLPKLIVINTTESLCTLEDSIMTAYLSLLGFDVLLLIPTGYQSVERFYTRPLYVEHQAGEYVYDMTVPDLSSASGSMDNLIGKLFKRGR